MSGEKMRVFRGSAPNSKEGWVEPPSGVAYDVWLNGRLVRMVVAADSIDGEVWQYTGGTDGGYWETEKLTGCVEIERAAPSGVVMRD